MNGSSKYHLSTRYSDSQSENLFQQAVIRLTLSIVGCRIPERSNPQLQQPGFLTGPFLRCGGFIEQGKVIRDFKCRFIDH